MFSYSDLNSRHLALQQGVGLSFFILKFHIAVYRTFALEPIIEIMSESKHVVKLHRVIKASPEKLYRAYTDPLAIASWIPPYGFLCQVHEMDVRVGGNYKMSFVNFTTGNGHSFGGKYLDLKENELIRQTDIFDDPNLPGQMITTVHLKQVTCGTEISIVQEGIPEMIPLEMCYLGWQESLEKLTKLVEPKIPDA